MTNDISGSDFASPNIQNEPKATFGIRLIAHIFDAVMVMLVSFPFAIVSTIVEENGSSSGADAITLLGIIVCLGVYSWWIGNQGGSPLRRTIGVLVLDERTGAFIGTKRGVKGADEPSFGNRLIPRILCNVVASKQANMA
jgi:hypothetical protein